MPGGRPMFGSGRGRPGGGCWPRISWERMFGSIPGIRGGGRPEPRMSMFIGMDIPRMPLLPGGGNGG